MDIEPSIAQRIPSSRKRGSVVVNSTDPFVCRDIWAESGLEEKWLQILIADPEVREVREQQLAKVMVDGKLRRHWFDFLIIWIDGTRSACAVKYLLGVTPDLEQLLVNAAKQLGDRFASDYRLLTERDLDLVTLGNARQVIEAGKDFDYEAQDCIRAWLPSAPSSISLPDFDLVVGDGQRGRRAALALLKSGELSARSGEVLGPSSILCNRFTN